MWRLLEGEYVQESEVFGSRRVNGPRIVRVQVYPELGKMGVQSGQIHLEVDGTDFAVVVKRSDEG